MGFQYRAECDCCDYKSEFIWPLWASYRWPDGITIKFGQNTIETSGATLELAQRIIWCNACSIISIGEGIIALEVMERLAKLEPIQSLSTGWDQYTKIHWDQSEIDAALNYARYPRYAHLYEHLWQPKRWGLEKAIILNNTLDLHMEWRRRRASAAHCLSCGRFDFIDVGLNDDEEPNSIVHPGCGGVIQIMKGHKVRQKSSPGLWTIEGEQITSKV